jgi:hypothetical protein
MSGLTYTHIYWQMKRALKHEGHTGQDQIDHTDQWKKQPFYTRKKVTSGMKRHLASQLSDGKLKDYIIDKGKLTQYTFGSVAWWD